MSFFGDLSKTDLEQFFPEYEVKRAYTQDENYRAYKMFSMMDVDNGGALSLRELKRVLMGEAVRYVSAEFDHPDTGIIFGLDEEKCVIIADIEMDSTATKFPFLIQRMRLFRINDFIVKKHSEKSLNEVFQELLRLHDEPVRLEFYEPEIIINKFTCFLDIEVDAEVFSVVLPIGAVYNHVVFCEKIQQLMCDTSIMLDHIGIEFIPEKRQIIFRSEEEPFRLLFATGPNFRRSCRYTLGFEGEDYPYAYEHAGQPMLMDLRLGVTQDQAEILMSELFVKYDRDNSGEFEFEEFRDFYIRYLDSEDSLDRLRKYALYRFRDIEKEKFVMRQRQARVNKLKRREYLREKNKEIAKEQRARFMADSFVDKFGNRRRIYRHRTVNRLTNEGDKKITLLKEEAEQAEDAFEEMMKATRATLTAAMAGTDKKDGDDKKNANISGSNSVISHDELHGFNATVLNKQEAKLRVRFIQKQKQQHQTQKRKEILRRMVLANRELKNQARQNARLHQVEGVDMQTMDLHYRIKRELADSVDVSANDLYENIQSYGVDVSRLITTPTVKITSAVLGDTLDRNSVDVVAMSSTIVHPASLYYYHVKENQKSSKVVFDSERFHPAFFTADYTRHSSRHSHLAFGLAKTMFKARQEGVRYRVTHGMNAELNHVYPPDEDLTSFLSEKRKWEEENNPMKDLKKSGAQRKRVTFAEIVPVGQRGLVGRLTILSIKLENLASVHTFAKNSPFVNLYVGNYKFVTEAYSFAGSVCEWDDLNWVIRLHNKDFLQLDVFSGSTTNFAYIGSHHLTSKHIMELRFETENIILIEGKLYSELRSRPSTNKRRKRNSNDGDDEVDQRKVMGIFHIRANFEKGKDWDWFIQNYDKTQAKAERIAAEKKRLSASYSGPREWLNIRTYFPLELQIVDVVLFDVHSSLASWIFKSRITLTLDAGRSEYTTDDNYAIVHSQDSAEWNKLQWEFLVESPEVNLIYKIYAHGKYIGRYVLSAASLAEKLTATTHELEFTGELVVNLGEKDSKIVGKVMTKMLVNPTSGQEITRYRELNPAQPTIEDHLRPDYLVGLPAIFLFEKAELSASNLHSITFFGTYILRLQYEHYRFETKIDVPSRTKQVVIPSLDWQIPLHPRKKMSIILENSSLLVSPEMNTPAIVHFLTDELSALEKDEQSGVVIRKFVFVNNEIKAKVAFYATVSLERDFTGIDRFMYDTDPSHNLRVVDPVFTKDGVIMIEGNTEFWEMQGKYYRSKAPGDDEIKTPGKLVDITTLDDLRGSTTSLPGRNAFSIRDNSVHTGDPVYSNNVSLPVTMQVTEMLVTDLYNVHYLVKNSPRGHVICGKQALCTTVSTRAGAHAFWSGLDMSFTITSYDHPVRISVDSQEIIIGECSIPIIDIFASRPNKSGMREILSTLTITMKNQKQQVQHQIRGKVKIAYFLDQANKIGIPVSDIQFGALKFIDYPVQLVFQQITVTNLRSVHLFGRNSPLVKMLELGPNHTNCFTTSMLKQAGGYGKWMQLMWSSVVRDEVTTFHFQVLSESLVIGSAEVTGDALVRMVPTSEGICEMLLPLMSIEDHLRGGELHLVYSYEPYIEIDGDNEGDTIEGVVSIDEAKNPTSVDQQLSNQSSSSYLGMLQGPNSSNNRSVQSLPSRGSSGISLFRSKNNMPSALQVVADPSPAVKDHHLIMLCTVVIVLRRPKAKKVAAAKNRRASNPEDYPVWNLSTTRAQLVCGKYIHAVRMKCQQLMGTRDQSSHSVWNDQDSVSAESLMTQDTRHNRNNSSIILRSAPLVEKFVMSEKKSLHLRFFDGNDLTIGDAVCTFSDVEKSPTTTAGFRICDLDMWKDAELVGLIRLQLRVTEDIPPIIRATLIDNKELFAEQSNQDKSSLLISHPSMWSAERRLAYPLGVKFNEIAMVDIDEELFIPKALLQMPVSHEKDGNEMDNQIDTIQPKLVLDHVEIFLRVRFAGEIRTSMTTFAISSDVSDHALIWELMETGFNIAHDQETWIFEIIALGKVIGICKIPAFDLRYARELHLRQVADEQSGLQGDRTSEELIASLGDSTLFFNVWNAQKKICGRLMIKFKAFELFCSSEEHNRSRALLRMSTPRLPHDMDFRPTTNAADLKPLGFIRFTLLHAQELRQMYAMFANSPRVKITIGERVYETLELVESGGEGLWDQLSWGRVYLRQNIPKIIFTVYSHNEIIGTWEIAMKEFIDSIQRAKEFAKTNKKDDIVIDESGTVVVQLTGTLWKNRRMSGQITARFLGHIFDWDKETSTADVKALNKSNGTIFGSGFFHRQKSFFSQSSNNILPKNQEESNSLVIGERSSTIVLDPELDNPPAPPETMIDQNSSSLQQGSMDGIPLPQQLSQNDSSYLKDNIAATLPMTSLQRALHIAELQHHPQQIHNSYASTYKDMLPTPGIEVPQNTLTSSTSLVNEDTSLSPVPEIIDFQFIALSISHIRRNPNEEVIEFSYKNPPKLYVTCGGWIAETLKLSTVSESSVTTQFKWLVSRFPSWHFQTEGTPFMKISLQTSDTKRLLGSVFVSMTDLLQATVDHVGLMHIGRTLVSQNDEPVAQLELVYRVLVRIQQDQTAPWWISTGIDPGVLNQSWSMLSSTASQVLPRPDKTTVFAHAMPNPTLDDDSKTLFSSSSSLSMNTFHMLTASVEGKAVMVSSNNTGYHLLPPVMAPPFILVITRAALTQIQTPTWMMESDAVRCMIVIRAFTHYTGYATSTIATAANEVFWEELEGNGHDAPLPNYGVKSLLDDGMYEPNAREYAWQFRFFDWKEIIKMEVFNLAKPFGYCAMNAQEILKLPRTMQGEIDIHLPVMMNNCQNAMLHFTSRILPIPTQEDPSEEKTVASIAAELEAIERNEHLACIMRMKFISCEDISLMAHEIRIKVVSEHEGVQVSPNLKNLYGNVQYAPTSWQDIKFYQRSLANISVIDHKGEVLGAATVDVYDIQRAPIDQRPLTANSDFNEGGNNVVMRPETGVTAEYSPGKDHSYANWIDTGSQSPRSQRRRRRRNRWQNIAVMYLDLILGPAKRGRLAIAFERLSPAQYQTVVADDNIISARSDISEEVPIVRQLSAGWAITIQVIRLSHLKPVHQFGKNSPLVTLEVTGRKFQTDCRAFAGKKASFEDLSWMLDCREKVAMKFKVTSASVTIGLCSILMDELFVHPLDRHFELEIERTLVKDKNEMGTIVIKLQGHPPLPPLSTNTGYIDSSGSIVTIRTQGENQSMHFRPVDLGYSNNVDYQSLLQQNLEAYRLMQEMDIQTVRSITLASSSRLSLSGEHSVLDDANGPLSKDMCDDNSTIYTNDDGESDFHSITYHPHSGQLSPSENKSPSKLLLDSNASIPAGENDQKSKSSSSASLHQSQNCASTKQSTVIKNDNNKASHTSTDQFSIQDNQYSLPRSMSISALPSNNQDNSKLSLQDSPRPPTLDEIIERQNNETPNQILTSRSWDGGISNFPAAITAATGRPRTSRGPEHPRFLPKMQPSTAADENNVLSSSQSMGSLPSHQGSRRRSALTAQISHANLLEDAKKRKYSLGSALEGTMSLVEASFDEEHQEQTPEAEQSKEESNYSEQKDNDGPSENSASQYERSKPMPSYSTSSTQEESTVISANDASESTVVYARPGYAEYDGESLYSQRTKQSESYYSEPGDHSLPSSARSYSSRDNAGNSETSNTDYYDSSYATSRSSSVHFSHTSSTDATPRSLPVENEGLNDDIIVLENLDSTPGSPATMEKVHLDKDAKDSRPVSPECTDPPMRSRTQSLKSILKPSQVLQLQDDSTNSDSHSSDKHDDDDDDTQDSDDAEEAEEEEEDSDEDETKATEQTSVVEEESDDSSSVSSSASSSSSQSLPVNMTRKEINMKVAQFAVPSLRLLFLRDEQPIARNQMALLMATDVSRAIIVQVVSSFIAMREGTSFMGARRQVANSLVLDFDRVPLPQRRMLISVDFVRQITFTAAAQAYKKLVIQRRTDDIDKELEEQRQQIAARKAAKRQSKQVNIAANKVANNADVPRDEAKKKQKAKKSVSSRKFKDEKEENPAPASPPHRKTLVKRLSVNLSPKANMKKRQAVTMTSGLSNPMVEKRQKSQEWSDKMEKELERKLMLSKPMRARIRILDMLGIDLTCIDAQVRPTRPYLTACKPFGNWAAETPIVKLDIIKPLPPALQDKVIAAQTMGMKEDDVSLPSLWHDTVAHDLGQHPMSKQDAYVLNFTELYGKYRWEEFILRMGQEVLIEIRDAGSNLVVAKCILSYPTFISKLPGDQETFESSLFVVFEVANEFGGGKLSGILRVRLDLSVNVFARTKKSASYWEKHRPQHWMFYPLTPINFGAVRQKYREIADDYDKQRLVHPSYFGFCVRIRGNEEDEGRFLHPVFSGYNLAKKLSIAKSAVNDAKVQAMKTRAANPFRFDPGLKDIGKCPICGDGLPGCPRCFMMPTKEYDGSYYAPREFAFDPLEERKKALLREQRIVALKAKRRRRLSSLQFSSIEDLNLESLGLSKVLTRDKIMTTGMSMADISKEIEKMFEKDYDTEVSQDERKEQAKLKLLHTRMTTFQAIRAARLSLQRLLNIYVKIMPTGNIVRLTMDAQDPVHLLYDRFNWHFPTNKNHHPMMLLPTSAGYFELHSELAFQNEMEIADTRGMDKLSAFFQVQERSCCSFVVLYFAHYVPQAVAPMMQSFFAANTTFALPKLPTYTGIDRTPRDLVKDEVQTWCVKVLAQEYRLQQEENYNFFKNLGKAFHQSAIAKKQKEALLQKQEKIFQAQQKKLIQQRFASQLKRLGTGGTHSALDATAKKKLLRSLESRERNKRKTQLFVDEKDNLLQTLKNDDSTVNNMFGLSKIKGSDSENDDDDLKSVLSLSAVQLDDVPFEGTEDGEEGSVYDESGSEYLSVSDSDVYSHSSYTSERSIQSEDVSISIPPPPKAFSLEQEDGKILPGGDPAVAAAILQQQQFDQAEFAKKTSSLLPKRKLSTIPSLSFHESTTNTNEPDNGSVVSQSLVSARSLMSHLTQSDFGGSSSVSYDYRDNDDDYSYDYDDDRYSEYSYDEEEDSDFTSLSDVESSIASHSLARKRHRRLSRDDNSSVYSRSDYSYSPRGSARSYSTTSSSSSSTSYGSNTPRSQVTYDTAATPYTLLSAQSLQPYPSVAADDDNSLPPANLLPLTTALDINNNNNHTQLTHTQQHAQRKLQTTLRQETIRLQDQLLGDRLPSTLELFQVMLPTKGRQSQEGVNLDIVPDMNGGIVPVQDVDDAMSIFSGHRQQMNPSNKEKRALERLAANKKKKLIRVLRPHEDVYGVGRDAPVAAGGNADDAVSLYSHRQQLQENDENEHDDSTINGDHEEDHDMDNDSLYSSATRSKSVDSNYLSRYETEDGSSIVSESSSGLFTYRDDVSTASKRLYGNIDDEENILSVHSMPSEASTLSKSRNKKKNNNKDPVLISGQLTDQFYHTYLQGKNNGEAEDEASIYSRQKADDDNSSSTFSSTSTSFVSSFATSKTASSSHVSTDQKVEKKGQSLDRKFPKVPRTIPDFQGSDSYAEDDDNMSQVTFATQDESEINGYTPGHSQEDNDNSSFKGSISQGNASLISLFSQSRSSYSGRSSHVSPSSSSGTASASNSVYSGYTSVTTGTSEDETARNTSYNRSIYDLEEDSLHESRTSRSTESSYSQGSYSSYSSYSSNSSHTSSQSYITASSGYSSSTYASSGNYTGGSDSDSRRSNNYTNNSRSVYSQNDGAHSQLGSSSLLAPLTATPTSTSASYISRNSSTARSSTSSYQGYGYLPEDSDGSSYSQSSISDTFTASSSSYSSHKNKSYPSRVFRSRQGVIREESDNEGDDSSHMTPSHSYTSTASSFSNTNTTTHTNPDVASNSNDSYFSTKITKYDENDDHDDDNGSVLSDSDASSLASFQSMQSNTSVSTNSSFVRRTKALREIAHAMSELGDTDMEPVAAPAVTLLSSPQKK